MRPIQAFWLIILCIITGWILAELMQSNNGDASKLMAGLTVPLSDIGAKYVEVASSCNHAYVGECIGAYAEPRRDSEVVARLRQGMVLTVREEVIENGEVWYKITFEDQFLYYPERITSDWYVAASDVVAVYKEGIVLPEEDEVPYSGKRIVVDISEQRLTAYEENGEIFIETAISTGLELSPTPVGEYTIFRMMPSRYMQGPIEGIPGSDYYDLQGVPWNLYFTRGGAVIHGAYWHDSFGSRYSHGCVNVLPETAKILYDWAELGTVVEVRS